MVAVDPEPSGADVGSLNLGSTRAVAFFEDFTNTTFPPPGWTETLLDDPGTDPDWSRVQTGGNPTISPPSPPAMAKFNSYSCPNQASSRLATPALDFSTLVAPVFRFQMSHDAGLPTALDRVEVVVSIDGGLTWSTTLATFNRYDAACSTACWQEHSVDLAAYVGQPTVIIGLVAISDYGNNFYIDDVKLAVSGSDLTTSSKTSPPVVVVGDVIGYSILAVNSGDATAIGATMVDVLPPGTSYVDGSIACDLGACSYNPALTRIEWAYDLPAATTAMISFQVDTDGVACGDAIVNNAVLDCVGHLGGAVTKSAQTQAIQVAPALAEGFEDIVFPPAGWGQTPLSGTSLWDRQTSGSCPTIAPHNGVAMARWNSCGISAGTSTRLYSPSVNLTAMSAPTLKFWMSHDGGYPTNPDDLQVQVSVDDGVTWLDLDSPIIRVNKACSVACWTNHQFDLSAYAGEANVRIGLVGWSEYGTSIFVDDVVVAEAWFPCPQVAVGPSYLASACPGQTVDYQLTVNNENYAGDVLDLASSGAWPMTVDPTSFSLPANGSATADVGIRVSWVAPAGDSDLASFTVTGQVSGLTDTAQIHTFASVAGVYTDLASIPPTDPLWRTRDHSIVHYGGKLYKFGGFSGTPTGAARDFTLVYDIATNTWSTADNMPAARYWLDCVEISGLIYCGGGYDTIARNTLYVFDPAAAPGSQWSEGANLPASRYGYTGVALGGLYYVIGGFTTSYQNTMVIYDPGTNTWTSGATVPTMSVPRRSAPGGAINGKIYVAGGQTGSVSAGPTYTNRLEVYDPVANAWSLAAPMPYAPPDGGWVRAADGVTDDRFLLVVGGYPFDATASSWTVAYDALNDVWMGPQAFGPHVIYGSEGDVDAAGNMWYVSGRIYETDAWDYSAYTTRVTGCPPCTPVGGPDFTWLPSAPLATQPVDFTGTVAVGSPDVEYDWDFGDTTTGEGTLVSHTYTNGGTYTVVMTASNCDGTSLAAINHDVIIDPVADLAVTKSDDPDPVDSGETLTYTLTVSNLGPDPAAAVVLTDTLPATVDLVSANGGPDWSCNPPVGLDVVCTHGTLAVGPAPSVLIVVTAPVGEGLLLNTAGVTSSTQDLNLTDNTAAETTEVRASSDLSISNSDGVATAVPGQDTLTYTIVVGNAGPSTDTAATVTDHFPAGLSCTWTCVGSGTGACTAGPVGGDIADAASLAMGDSVTYTAACTIASSITETLTNTASVAASATDPDPVNNAASDSVLMTPVHDLAITKTDGVDTVAPGAPVTYTVAVTNLGPSDAVAAPVSDSFPTALVGVAWTCVGAGGGVCGAGAAGNINDLADLPVGGSVTYTAAATVDPAASGTIANTAAVFTPGEGGRLERGSDPDYSNNVVTDVDNVVAETDLAITKDDGVLEVTPGAEVTYTITVSNLGPDDAVAALVSDVFPSVLTRVTWTCDETGGGSCGTLGGAGNIAELVGLPSGTSVAYTAAGTLDLGASGTLSNTATAMPTAGADDPQPANNAAVDADTVIREADLALHNMTDPCYYLPGDAAVYSLTVVNHGPLDVTDAQVLDAFPAAMAGVTWTCAGYAGGSCRLAGAGDINELVDLPVGGSVVFTAVGSVDLGATGALVNTATVVNPGVEPHPSDNSATHLDALQPPLFCDSVETGDTTAWSATAP